MTLALFSGADKALANRLMAVFLGSRADIREVLRGIGGKAG